MEETDNYFKKFIVPVLIGGAISFAVAYYTVKATSDVDKPSTREISETKSPDGTINKTEKIVYK